MTTLVNFAPSPIAPFQFQASLDGADYDCIVTWALFGARWWFTVNSQDGVAVVALPLIASPPDRGFSLTAGYFKSTIVFREATQTFEIT
jgi:hypothetical protein